MNRFALVGKVEMNGAAACISGIRPWSRTNGANRQGEATARLRPGTRRTSQTEKRKSQDMIVPLEEDAAERASLRDVFFGVLSN